MVNKEPLSIVFMDIDGVFNSHRYWLTSGETSWSENLDKDAVKAFNEILARTGAKVVISSAWRHIEGKDETIRILAKNGVYVDRIIDVTPDEDISDPRRHKEIKQWLEKNPHVDAWVAIDDSADILHLQHYVHTTMLDGLQDKHVQLAVDILEAQLKEKHELYLKMIDSSMDEGEDVVDPDFSDRVDWVEAYEDKRWIETDEERRWRLAAERKKDE